MHIIDHILGHKIRLNIFIKIESYRVCSLTTVELLEISNNKITWKTPKYLKNKLLNNHWIKKKITKEIRKCLKPSDNENVISKCVIKLKQCLEENILLDASIGKEERSQMHNLNFHLKILEKEQKIKTKTSIRKEIINIREKKTTMK